MSTNAIIGYERDDSKVEAIYLHWDGYLAHAGQILKHHYLGKQKIEDLMNLGDLSELGKNPVENPYGWNTYEYTKQPKSEMDNYCVSYAARGDKNAEKSIYENSEAFLEDNSSRAPFIYLFRDGKWYYYHHYNDNWKEV